MQLKTEGIGNKIVLITLLCLVFGLFLYLRPLLFAKEPKPKLIDRLPDAEIIAKVKIVNVIGGIYPALFKNKVKFREYLTDDFVLAQGKNYGLELLKDAYFFSDGEKEWGGIVPLSDSSKISAGFDRISQFYKVKDTVVHRHRLKKIEASGVYFYYDKSYLFVYKGKRIFKQLGKVLFARFGEIESSWRRFSKLKEFKKSNFLLYNQSKDLQKFGFDYAIMTQKSDSININFSATLHSIKPIGIKIKAPGMAFESNAGFSKSINIHLDVREFAKAKSHPLYKYIAVKGTRINFPLETFLNSWNGDLSFQEGGTQLIDEEVVELGYDEEFNPVEIRKIQKVPITGFSVLMSVNKNGTQFVNNLFGKGIINKQGNKYRFLFSPPLNLNILPESLSAYTGGRPKIEKGSKSGGYIKYNGVTYVFQLDHLSKHIVKGSLSFPFIRLTKVLNL